MFFPLVFALEILTPQVKILQLTDLHYGEGSVQDRLNAQSQSNLLSWENPDLVVITGDVVSGYAWPGSQGWFLASYLKFIAPFEQSHTPWALILGNHDVEADLSGPEIMALDRQQPLSLSSNSLPQLSHASNYYIPIKHNGKLKLVIWALDSGNRNHLEFGYDRVHEDQLAWIKHVQTAINEAAGEKVPGIAFLHIPPPEFMDLWPRANGHRFEDVACPGNHSRYLVGELGDIIALVAGHDHFNDYEGEMSGVRLFYGRKTGYAGVGPEPYFNKGARVFSYDFEILEKREGMMERQRICAESVDSRAWIFGLGVAGVAVAGIGLIYSKKNTKPNRLKI
jgi:hypothetical protein